MQITNIYILALLSITCVICSAYWIILGYISITNYEEISLKDNLFISRGISLIDWRDAITTIKVGFIIFGLLIILIKYRDSKQIINLYIIGIIITIIYLISSLYMILSGTDRCIQKENERKSIPNEYDNEGVPYTDDNISIFTLLNPKKFSRSIRSKISNISTYFDPRCKMGHGFWAFNIMIAILLLIVTTNIYLGYTKLNYFIIPYSIALIITMITSMGHTVISSYAFNISENLLPIILIIWILCLPYYNI